MRGAFFDTNLWVYLFSNDSKGAIVESLQLKHYADLVISTQILGELYNVLTRKKIKSAADAADIVTRITRQYVAQPITQRHVLRAMTISARYQLSYWDSLVVASALGAGCKILYSEDMQHEQVFYRKLKVINPFESSTMPI